jgi:hypothetical protein
MISSRTRHLLIAAAVMGGLLAGADLDREVVAMPAWQRIGAEAWATFSRHADLGNGLVLYPVVAIGSFLLTLAATVSLHLDRAASGRIAFTLYGASLLAAAGLLCTLKAAPIMLGIAQLDDPAALRQAFEGFRHWGSVRAVYQVLAFLAAVWALAEAGRPSSRASAASRS